MCQVLFQGVPDCSWGKESACNAGDTGDVGSNPGLERSPGEENGDPTQHSCLENPMDRGTWWASVCKVAKSWTQLSNCSKSFANIDFLNPCNSPILLFHFYTRRKLKTQNG